MRTKKNITYLSAVLFFFCLIAPMATAHGKVEELNPDVAKLIAEVPLKKEYREAGAVILLREVRAKVDPDGSNSATIHIVGKILDERAASDYSQLCIFFNSYYEETHLEFAHTIKASGEVTTVSKDAVQVKTPPSLTAEKSYTDTRVLTFSLPALEVGCAFEFKVSFKSRPIISEKFFESFFFNYLLRKIVPPYSPRIDPVYKFSFIIDVPETENFRYLIYNAKIAPSIKKKGNYISYAWEMKDLPAITIEQNMPDLTEIAPFMDMTSLKDWAEIDSWANRVFSPKIMVTEEIKSKAKDIIGKARTEQEKIESLFYYMQDRVEYVQADFNRGGYEPHAANEILKNQYGDCKDQVVLFITLLKAVGITAYPALIDPYPSSPAKKEIPTPNFYHAIVYVPNNEGGLWLDTTSGTEFPALSWADQDRWSFVIDGKGGKWLRTPTSAADRNQGILTFNFNFQGKNLHAEMLMAARGALSDTLKNSFKHLSSSEQKDVVREIVKSIYTNINIQKIEFSNLREPREPFKTKVIFQFTEPLGDSIDGVPFSSSGSPITSLFCPLEHLPSPDRRRYDYRLGFKFKLVSEWLCSPPGKNFIPKILPQDESLDNPMISLYTKYALEGDIFKARTEFTFKTARIEKKDYHKFYTALQDVMKKWTWEVLFVKKKIDEKGQKLEAEASASPQNASSLLELSKHYLTRGRYEEARNLLKKAVDIEPRNGEVHYFLGIALSYLGEDGAAKKEFDKAKSLGYRSH